MGRTLKKTVLYLDAIFQSGLVAYHYDCHRPQQPITVKFTKGLPLGALVSLRRLSDLSRVISQSFGPQGDLSIPRNRAEGVTWNMLSTSIQGCNHMYRACRVFSSALLLKHTHCRASRGVSLQITRTTVWLCRVPFKLMLSGRA